VNGTTRHDPNRLRTYVETRGWTAAEYVDRGVSRAKDRRHLIMFFEELQSLGVAFVSLAARAQGQAAWKATEYLHSAYEGMKAGAACLNYLQPDSREHEGDHGSDQTCCGRQ
jgi:hypothetical protein